MRIQDLGEEGFIGYLKEQFFAQGPWTGIGDDAAVIPREDGTSLLVTTDSLVEGVHFIKHEIPPEDLGYKLLAVNVSDIAAMGGLPEFAFLTVALPNDIDVEWIQNVMQGLKEGLQKWNIHLLGGDTVGSKRDIFLSLTLTGSAPSDQVKFRKGAKEGDILFVTGFLGSSGAGLKALEMKLQASKLINAHFHPNPAPLEGRGLASYKELHALMDVSDGLDIDLGRMLKASSCGAIIDVDKLPLSKELLDFSSKHDLDPIALALTGGEDYCLLGSIAKDTFEEVNSQFCEEFSHPLHKIGVVKADIGITYHKQAMPFTIDLKRFDHFV